MKSFIILAVAILGLLAVTCNAQEDITKVSMPMEVRTEVSKSKGLPKELDGLMWNRWTSKNFVVCSLDDTQAQYLHKHLELVKGWALSRWGMYDIDYSVPCKLICVGDRDLYKKLFNLKETKVEVRYDVNGKISENIIFLLIDGPPSATVPIPVAEVSLSEFAQKYNANFGLWTFKGMSRLNGTLGQIRERISTLKSVIDKDEPLYFSKSLMEMTPKQFNTLSEDKKRLYENCSLMMCLMIRKEMGQDTYLKLLKRTTEVSPEEAIKDTLGFESYDEFDGSFKRFLVDLTAEVHSGKTPDSYLQITEKSR